MLSPCVVRQMQKLASKKRRMSAASIALEFSEVEGQLVSAQTIRHTLQQVGLHGRRPRRKPLLKLLVLRSCGSLRETWILTCTVTFWSRRWCPPFRNCFPTKQPPQTHRQDYNCLAAEGKGDGVAKNVSRPEPYWVHVGHPQAEGGEAPCRTSSSSVMSLFMEEWKRMPSTTCAALVNSIPRRIKALLDNNGAPTKYWHFGHSFDVHLGCTHFLLPVIWTITVICWVIFRGQ